MVCATELPFVVSAPCITPTIDTPQYSALKNV